MTLMDHIVARFGGKWIGVPVIPAAGARVACCHANVKAVVQAKGGRERHGSYVAERICEHGKYLALINHAVWGPPDGPVTDVTPLHADLRLRPIRDGAQSVIFLLDDREEPEIIEGILCPRPTRFFPLNESPELAAHLEKAAESERAELADLVAAARSQQSGREVDPVLGAQLIVIERR